VAEIPEIEEFNIGHSIIRNQCLWLERSAGMKSAIAAA
jgi:pyridoxine 5'-phosphate synthase PdxJ